MKWIGVTTCVVLSLVSFASAQPHRAGKQPGAAPYYLVTKVTACDRVDVNVRGVTNLPPGSQIDMVALSLGRDSKSNRAEQSDWVRAPVRSDGSFELVIKPKTQRFSGYVIVNVVFDPRENQPASVLRVVGRRGHNLGDLDNPQLGIYSGKHAYLEQLLLVEFCPGEPGNDPY